jgi:hypothetical protein
MSAFRRYQSRHHPGLHLSRNEIIRAAVGLGLIVAATVLGLIAAASSGPAATRPAAATPSVIPFTAGSKGTAASSPNRWSPTCRTL